MNIAILGAGGVGGYFGGILARAGNRVALLARGAHLEALQEGGLEVRTPEGTFTVAVEAVGDAEEMRGIELAVVAVKSYSLAEIAPAEVPTITWKGLRARGINSASARSTPT